MTALDPRAPLVLDARQLERRPGSMTQLRREVDTPEFIGSDVIAIPAGGALALQLRLESVMEGVLVSGTVQAVANGACVRCLESVEVELDVPFQEMFAYADRAEHHREVGADDDAEEQRVIENDLIDLDPVLRDAIVPALPFQPLCQDDCPGLCAECGARLADDPTHFHDNIDPRWAALSNLAQPGASEPSAIDNEKRN